MKNAKRIISTLLAAAMLFSFTACTPKEDDKKPGDGNSTGKLAKEDWKGLEFDVALGLTDLKITDNPDDWMNNGIKADIQKWIDETGVKINLKAGGGEDVLLAAQVAGKGYDLMYQSAFPSIPASGLAAPLDGYLDAYKDVFDCPQDNTFKGKIYGLTNSKNSFVYGMQINQTAFENAGVKSPREYFLEDNWTWETFLECAKAMTKDTNGDGVTDVWGCSYENLANYWTHSLVTMKDDGSLASNLDSDYNRDVIQFIYDLVNVHKVVPTDAVAKADLTAEKGSVVMRPWASLYGKVAENGDLLTNVPMPKQNKDAKYISRGPNDYRYYVGAACKNPEVMVDLAAVNLKYWNKYRDQRLEKKNVGETLEYCQKLNETLMAVNVAKDFRLKGVTNYLPTDYGNKDWSIVFTTPTATALATLVEKHKSEVDRYNKTYVNFN